MNKSETKVVRNVIKRLRGERASDDVKKALTTGAGEMFLESWVIPALELLVAEGTATRGSWSAKVERRENLKLAQDLSNC